jgi:hypothetical protein
MTKAKPPIPDKIILTIKEHYTSQSVYDECITKINNDLFPTKVYRRLQCMKEEGLGDYKVGGSTALKLASADNTWENDDVDIMVNTQMDTYQYAAQLGLTTCIKSWTKGVDPSNLDKEEKFHENIYQVLTFQYDDFDKKIQLVFFDEFRSPSFIHFLDQILDYPPHVLYEVEVDKVDRKIYKFFLPMKMWESILEKRIPRNLHCLQSEARLQKYIERGFEFFTEKAIAKAEMVENTSEDE